MNRPSRDETSMDLAKVMAKRSTCQRGLVGVVISREGRVLSTGYNGVPAGMPHCDHTCSCKDVVHLRPLLQDKVHNVHFPQCDFHPDSRCTKVVHAEANAVSFAARHGIALEGAEVFTTLAPCSQCAKLLINAGVVAVHCGQEYSAHEGVELLRSAGIRVVYPFSM